MPPLKEQTAAGSKLVITTTAGRRDKPTSADGLVQPQVHRMPIITDRPFSGLTRERSNRRRGAQTRYWQAEKARRQTTVGKSITTGRGCYRRSTASCLSSPPTDRNNLTAPVKLDRRHFMKPFSWSSFLGPPDAPYYGLVLLESTADRGPHRPLVQADSWPSEPLDTIFEQANNISRNCRQRHPEPLDPIGRLRRPLAGRVRSLCPYCNK